MLDPFVGVTQRLMLSKHDSVVVLALKIFALLLPIRLPSMEEELPWALKNTFFLLQRGGATSSLTMQASFKVLTVLLREAQGQVPTPEPRTPNPKPRTPSPRALYPKT